MVRHWFLVPAFGGSNPSIPAKHEHYSVILALLTGVLFCSLSSRRGDRYISGGKGVAAPPLEKGSSPAKYLASVHDFDAFVTPVGCTDGVVDLTTFSVFERWLIDPNSLVVPSVEPAFEMGVDAGFELQQACREAFVATILFEFFVG